MERMKNPYMLKPREESRLPAKFSDAECAAYVWLIHRGIRPWTVDLLNKGVQDGKGTRWPGLIQFATHHGWEGMA